MTMSHLNMTLSQKQVFFWKRFCVFCMLVCVSRTIILDKAPRKRAVLEKDKLTKRTNIIQAAATLLLKKDLNDLSMDEVAKRAKVAKGTLYLYFPTKEDLCLRVHISDYQLWFDDLGKFLDTSMNTNQSFVDWFVTSFERHPRFVKILPIVPTILEKSAGYETIKEYKSELLTHLQSIMPRLTQKLGFKNESDTFMLILQCHAIAIGSWSHGFPSSTVKQILSEENMQVFQINYFQFVKSSIETLIQGYIQKN
jgi:AcrR family transcriptional regulator